MTDTSSTVRVSTATRLYVYVSLSLVAAIVLVPLVTTALGGFKTLGDLRLNPFGLPSEWVWSNYVDILFGERYWRQMMNSLIIAGVTVFLTLVVSSMAAFCFAHIRFFGSNQLLNYFLIGLMFPAATAILPLFIRIRDLGLLDSYWGVILPQVAFGLGMSILLFRNYFRNLPEELFQAAFVDGCGYIRFFWYISLPLSRPIVATVGIVTFVSSWNSYILPLIMLNTESKYPWPLGIMVYRGEFGTDWQLVLAFITLTILPTIIVFFLAQKHIIAGLTAGAVKS
ncbi:MULTISPECIES: carbohydrate ABC transporter permease [unclassified Rhizobium]|jgi:raffinose/stachyose/melibiose transport system permease protein|uniref:carbohydrate ABC transporter permease n=1 Tax=Rhizobium/Agrobacterium group TaxID=227290 RepID=UPI0008A78A92|nr:MULTISPECIES: carbohydrate ABC transporter permease [unclassified Rhizobium]MBD8653055.1 carbohydrate ABC transporter permease [Rhizobium sp. CFBP 13726]MBP2459861.1 raffinose/stachyose/melibiose transport system permease protein [Rhizobium sp. PvP014]MBP2531220.1 raffinose/stachyose/melibiose transport system permease protein [Rhizobium sp. PvP099]SEH26714.1 carbohydrate ABC transporter membrane protein 2, CUT1 family (TC 3.A.1.1.-) [Rhizobium sp. NFR12]